MSSISSKKGFTLIEIMIVIAIIGLLAAIAIPNFLRHRDKSFCSAAETDGKSTAAAISDYYAVPSRHGILVSWADLDLVASNGNVVSVGGNIDDIIITVTDSTGRCPVDYTSNSPHWNGSVFTTRIQ